MKISKSFIATAVIAVLPLVAFGGDKDKTPAPSGTAATAQFDMLDANRDGRISREEAATDSKIVFSTADKNGDGYSTTVSTRIATCRTTPRCPKRPPSSPAGLDCSCCSWVARASYWALRTEVH